jgi:hypothetical protein
LQEQNIKLYGVQYKYTHCYFHNPNTFLQVVYEEGEGSAIAQLRHRMASAPAAAGRSSRAARPSAARRLGAFLFRALLAACLVGLLFQGAALVHSAWVSRGCGSEDSEFHIQSEQSNPLPRARF